MDLRRDGLKKYRPLPCMKIISVVENESEGRLRSEKGLSLMVETSDANFLIDTGATSLVLENLTRLGFAPEEIRNIIISHNHNDHIGGLPSILEVNSDAHVFISENAVGEFIKFDYDKIEILSDNSTLYSMPERFTEVGDMEAVGKNVFVCHVASPKHEHVCRDSHLMEIVDSEMYPDDFRHEVYIVVIENDRYNIISPCSHNGIINIINDAKERFGRRTLNAFIGGLHIEGSDKSYLTDEEIEKLAEDLNETGIKSLYTCHCTGRHAYGILKEKCKFHVSYFITGDFFTV